MRVWIRVGLFFCLLGAWGVGRANGENATAPMANDIDDNVVVWLSLSGEDPFANKNIGMNSAVTGRLYGGAGGEAAAVAGAGLFEEDPWFGVGVFRCASSTGAVPTALVVEGGVEGGIEVSAPYASLLSSPFFAASFWFRVAADGAGLERPQDLLYVPTGDAMHVHAWLSGDGDVCVGTGCTSGLELNDGGWHHVTITSALASNASDEIGLVDVYVDGNLQSSGEMEVSVGAGGNDDAVNIMVCTWPDGNASEALDGYIIDLVVFDRGLSRDEVVLNYNLRNNPFTGSSAMLSGGASTASTRVCSDVLIPGVITTTECGEGHGCFKIHEDHLSQLRPDGSGGSLRDYAGRIGVCAPDRYINMLPSSNIVRPALAFFPLNMNQMWSYPLGVYRGTHREVSLVEDAQFGQALYCNGSEYGFVGLDPVPYGLNGMWSINLWFKPEGVSLKEHSWLFSHGANGDDPYGANQVQIYLTERQVDGGGADGYAHVTAVVHDGNDEVSLWDDGVDTVPVLHGDGAVGEFGVMVAEDDAEHDVRDGDWHMVTLTSGQGEGYILYLDGEEVNRLSGDEIPRNVLGNAFAMQGGDMLVNSMPMFLCGRGYSDEETFPFSGRLAFLSLWNAKLMPEEVAQLYETVQSRETGGTLGLALVDPFVYPTLSTSPVERYTVSGRLCEFPAIWAGDYVNDCVFGEIGYMCPVDGLWEPCGDRFAVDNTIETEWTDVGQRAEAGSMWDMCLLSVTPRDAKSGSPQGCSEGLMCVPLEEGQPYNSTVGRCDATPSRMVRFDIFNYIYQMGIDQPLSVYPLVDQLLDEVTVPGNSAMVSDIGWPWSDAAQALVPMCMRDRSVMNLTLSTTKSSEHTECVWFMAMEPFGTPQGGNESDHTSPPARQVLLSQDMVRVVLELVPESHEQYALLIEGSDGSQFTRTYPESTGTLPNVVTYGKATDEQWHFVCLTASTEMNSTTVDLYLDAVRIETVTGRDSSGLHDGVGESHEVSLCPAFNGLVSFYLSFGQALTPDQIQTLYSDIQDSGIMQGGQMIEEESEDSLSGGAIAGIVVGSILGCALILAVGLVMFKRSDRMRQTRSRFKKHKDSNVAGPNDDDTKGPGETVDAGELAELEGDDQSLRRQFSAYYSPSELSAAGLSRNMSENRSGNLTREFSYEYDPRETMAVVSPKGKHVDQDVSISTPEVPPTSKGEASALTPSDSGTE